MATAASLTLAPGTPAYAALSCNSYSTGGVSFRLCVERTNASTVKVYIGNITGTYVSGKLQLQRNSSVVKTACNGRFNPGEACQFTYASSSGSFKSVWVAANGSTWSSPTI